jgi:hypothetical protein
LTLTVEGIGTSGIDSNSVTLGRRRLPWRPLSTTMRRWCGANPLATRAWCRQRLLQAPSRHAPGSYPEGDAGEHERGADQCLLFGRGAGRRERPAPARGVPVVGAGAVGGSPARVVVVLVPLWWSSWWWSSTLSAAVSVGAPLELGATPRPGDHSVRPFSARTLRGSGCCPRGRHVVLGSPAALVARPSTGGVSDLPHRTIRVSGWSHRRISHESSPRPPSRPRGRARTSGRRLPPGHLGPGRRPGRP